MTQDLLTSAADERRDAYIAHYGLLDSPPGRDLQALVELLAHVCEVPKAAVNIITSTMQHQVVATGFDPAICTREDSMCGIVMDDARPVVVADASLDPRFADNPFVNGEIGNVRFYASAALTTSDGTPIGRLCIFDRAPHELTAMQRQALETLAAQVMDLFDLRVRSLELERSLQDLIAARDELSRSNGQLAHFAGQVSHDLRAPLTAILANAEMLMLEDPVTTDPDVASMVSAVSASGQRMATMIDSMLSTAQEGGELREQPTRLNDVFDHALNDLHSIISSSGAQVVVDDLETVTVDPQMLYSVALNLLTNALKFTRPDQPARIHVSSQQVDGAYRVRVQDNGIGVPIDQREAVFALFARADTSAAGNGVGLTTVRQAIEAHGGQVGIENASGGGTVVWFDLPQR